MPHLNFHLKRHNNESNIPAGFIVLIVFAFALIVFGPMYVPRPLCPIISGDSSLPFPLLGFLSLPGSTASISLSPGISMLYQAV